MIHAGTCSLTLPTLSLEQVVEEAAQAGLTHIEWWGKDHVPMGDIDAAVKAGELTRRAGLQVSTYGSYYRVGESDAQGVDFEDVFETALAMEAPAIRVWAGTKGSEVATDEHRQVVIDEALLIADVCGAADVDLVFEYHGNSLTDTNESTVAFMEAVQHPAIHFGWQVRTGALRDEVVKGLGDVRPRLATVHVFNWSNDDEGKRVRYPLRDAVEEWRVYFGLISATERDHVALLEFVRDNSVEQFREDAETLKNLLAL